MIIPIRRKLWMSFGHRKSSMIITLLAWILLLFTTWKVSYLITRSLMPPPPPDQDLSHFRRSRNLSFYLDNIGLIIEPSSSIIPCLSQAEVKVLVLVTSAPNRYDRRQAIRQTWGRHLPTYFVIGIDKNNNDHLVNTYAEAKINRDLIVYDFKDHYQNLTLKVGLMLKWTVTRCPNIRFLYKTDDDMMINPWMLEKVLEERGEHAQVLGYVHHNAPLHRDEYNKWYLPRWLCTEDVIPQYVTGPGYLIGGPYIAEVLEEAKLVPLHNIEDVFYTYNVAKKSLGYNLVHDGRLFPYRPWPPWLPIRCAYWTYASVHSLDANEILRIWSYLDSIGKRYVQGERVCQFFDNYIKFWIKTYPF